MHEAKHGWNINMHEARHGWNINIHFTFKLGYFTQDTGDNSPVLRKIHCRTLNVLQLMRADQTTGLTAT